MKRFVAATVLALLATLPAFSGETNDVLFLIEHMASAGRTADRSLGESIAEAIEKAPKVAPPALIERLADKNLSEEQLAVYVWALGLMRDPAAVGQIETLHAESQSDWVRANCRRAVATIGGGQAEKFLLATLGATTDKEGRFDVLNLLGQMQSEAALPKAEEVLQLDIEEFYWQPIFVFGKMGDKATSFLLQKINDTDRNTRANSINVLGQWLIPPEAAKPLEDQYWMEKDPKLRVMILGALERTMLDFAAMTTFFERVADEEKEKDVARVARETLENMDEMKALLATVAQQKKPSPEAFQEEYALLFKSCGKEGDYDVLGRASTADDEPRLKGLRERILQRDSDEAFYDYQKINEIIMGNRLLKTIENIQAVPPASAGDPQPERHESRTPEK